MKATVKSLALVMLMSNLWSLGCKKRVDLNRANVVGTYRGTFEGVNETLVLKPGEVYVLERNEHEVATGEWELVPYDGEMRIALHDFPDHGNKGNHGDMSVALLGVQENISGLRIYLSYDLNRYYSKVN